jgi:hypothetical protein
MSLLTVASPFLALPAFRGKTTNRDRYSFSRSTLSVWPSSLLLLLRWSTEIPSPLASFFRIPASLSSEMVNPRPSAQKSALPAQILAGTLGRRTSDTDVVSLSGASDGRSESLQGGGTGSEGLLGSSSSSRLLLARLVELVVSVSSSWEDLSAVPRS